MITDTTIAGLQLQDPNVCPLDIVESHPTVVAGGTTAVDTVKFEDLGQENPVLENFFGPVHPVFGSDQSNGFNYFHHNLLNNLSYCFNSYSFSTNRPAGPS